MIYLPPMKLGVIDLEYHSYQPFFAITSQSKIYKYDNQIEKEITVTISDSIITINVKSIHIHHR